MGPNTRARCNKRAKSARRARLKDDEQGGVASAAAASPRGDGRLRLRALDLAGGSKLAVGRTETGSAWAARERPALQEAQGGGGVESEGREGSPAAGVPIRRRASEAAAREAQESPDRARQRAREQASSASVVGADDAATPGSDPPPKPDDRPSVPRGDDLDAPPESDDHNVPPHDLPRKDHSEADDVPPPDRDALEGDVPEADDDAAEGDAAEGEHNVEDGDHDAAEHNTAEGDDPCSKDAASEEEKTERKRARDEPVCRFSVQGRCWIAAKAKAEESGKASVCRFVSWRKEARKKPVVVDLTEDDPKGPRMSEEDVACAETLRGGLRDKGDKGSSAAPIDVTPIDVTDAGGAKAAAPADATGATAAEPIDVTLDDEPAEPAPEPTRRTKRVFAPRRSGRPATSARLEDELKHYANEQERLLAESRRRFLRSHSDAFPEALPRWQSRNPYVVLGVPPNADFATCRKAFHKLALKYHPDKSKTPHSRDIFDSISKAYHSLSTTASTFETEPLCCDDATFCMHACSPPNRVSLARGDDDASLRPRAMRGRAPR
eukprot:CAMPEP_0197390104 /NCGR_PEP_ID=MMETSP1165-20131217/2175_1 /TAXON_ID=284809 /ORGANISM="Chrysocystis fragilis, Strain CCMP3189" /LENGTH=551 /DNA_ID=CAMNT_0042915567 /DNA_START=1 /DNA_END=1655 /DNA_ORIENTATION=+